MGIVKISPSPAKVFKLLAEQLLSRTRADVPPLAWGCLMSIVLTAARVLYNV